MKKEKTYYWPFWFSKLLNKTEQQKIKTILPKIQAAQILLWDALNIYDDFLDGEGKPEKLPTANKLFRRYLELFYRLNLSNDYYHLFNTIFDNLDKTNTKEAGGMKLKIKNGLIAIPEKLPKPENIEHLSDKSLALSLSSLALLSFLGYKASDKKMKAATKFFRYALAAKQLADDSYDWLEDLKSGCLTAANTPILKAAGRKGLKLDLKDKPEILYLLFAQESSPIIIANIEKLCLMARKEIRKINGEPDNALLANLISPLENACRESRTFTRSVFGDQKKSKRRSK